MFEFSAWMILLLPLLAAAGISLFTSRNPRLSGMISIGAVALGFLFSLVLWVFPESRFGSVSEIPWLSVGDLEASIGIQLDRLSLLMCIVVTGVGTLIHIFSVGYMGKDPAYSRFFACLSLFMFSMIGIVLSHNFVQMFIFWELVGLSSYLLIGFWFEKPSAADAAKKAFLTNRVGDFGFLLGILMVWGITGTVHFEELTALFKSNPAVMGSLATLASLLLFCGAMGKSAQFPLHVWLPDAMEGPTPVSALIHAATMVAAGVYMLCRIFFLLTPDALLVIGWLGGITALLAALIAVQQDDIKRILAYSTLSQLGYMVMAVGVAAPDAAMYHLTTHAFFKALLFLGAGSIIYALHHEQNIWNMGGLRNRMPTTWKTFFIGTLALCGVPPLSGFFSKDAILVAAWNGNPPLFAIALGVAVLTNFYMFRLVFVVFGGAAKTKEARQAVESPHVMTRPLLVLALFSMFAGFFGLDLAMIQHFHLQDHGHGGGNLIGLIFAPFSHAPGPAMLGLLAVMLGFSMAWSLYRDASQDPLPESIGAVTRILRNRFYFDEGYTWIIQRVQGNIARFADGFDRWILAGFMVKGAHGATDLMGRALRLFQTGNLHSYALFLGFGVLVVLFLAL